MTPLLLILSVVIGALLSRFFRSEDRSRLRLLTAFGGAYVFTITILHLLPEVYGQPGHGHEGHAHGPTIAAGWFILLGFFIQIFLEFISHGIEHGHAHHGHQHGVIPVGVMVGLCIHSFLEGMPLGEAGWGWPAERSHQMLLAGIVMHNLPVTVVLISLFWANHVSPGKTWLWLAVFALMSPLGALASHSLAFLAEYQTQLTGMVIGIFLHLSTTILFEAGEEHHINRRKLFGILAGTGVAILTTLAH